MFGDVSHNVTLILDGDDEGNGIFAEKEDAFGISGSVRSIRREAVSDPHNVVMRVQFDKGLRFATPKFVPAALKIT